jgi:hypothetical protein
MNDAMIRQLDAQFEQQREMVIQGLTNALTAEKFPSIEWRQTSQGELNFNLEGYGITASIEHETTNRGSGWRRDKTGNAMIVVQQHDWSNDRQTLRYPRRKDGTWNWKQAAKKVREMVECVEARRDREKAEKERQEAALRAQRQEIGEVATCATIKRLDNGTYKLDVSGAWGLSLEQAKAINDILKQKYPTREEEERQRLHRRQVEDLEVALLNETRTEEAKQRWEDSYVTEWTGAGLLLASLDLLGPITPLLDYPTYDVPPVECPLPKGFEFIRRVLAA